MAAPIPVVIDTDCGVDDAVALFEAVTNPALDVVAITAVWGNCDADVAALNVLRVLDAAGRDDIPVAVGHNEAIGPTPGLRRADFIHGSDGLGNTFRPPPSRSPIELHAVELLRQVVDERPGEVAVVSVGPLSNVGAAVRADATWAGRVLTYIAMAGAARTGGNALPAGEANVANDPGAAASVVEANWSSPPLLVGLDVTLRATLTEAEFAIMGEHHTPAAAFLDEPLRFYRQYGSTFTAPDCPCHDLLAVLALADPEIITEAPVLPLAIDTAGGPAWGATVVDFRQPFFDTLDGSDQHRPDGFAPWRIALEADIDRFRRHVRRLFGEPG